MRVHNINKNNVKKIKFYKLNNYPIDFGYNQGICDDYLYQGKDRKIEHWDYIYLSNSLYRFAQRH